MSDKFSVLSDNSAKATDKKTAKIILIIIAAVVCAAIVFSIGLTCLIKGVLNAQKDTQEYQMAYSYLVGSESFKMLGADESDIIFNQYSTKINSSDADCGHSEIKELGFTVNGSSFTVVLHRENGELIICDECTLFD